MGHEMNVFNSDKPEALMASVLVFPCSNDAAQHFNAFCQSINKSVVLATSEKDYLENNSSKNIEFLPYIYDPDFLSEFRRLIERTSIDSIYSPVTSVHEYLKQIVENEKIDVSFASDSPIAQQEQIYNKLLDESSQGLFFVDSICRENRLSKFDIASISRQAKLIYGESNQTKLFAMMAIFSTAPKGDVIEVGSLMGRTAFVLNYLSCFYDIGSVLAIDPWSSEAAVQKDSPELFQTTLANVWDCELLSNAFIINLLPFARKNFNFLRMTSEEGFGYYLNNDIVTSEYFGSVSYEKSIAVIHIDGNHDYDMVKKDCDLWLKNMAAGAWLILDDYLWAHGDGPKRVGDEILNQFPTQIRRSFVCGKALFIQYV